MGTRSPEGGNPYNIDPRTVRVAPEQRRFGRGFKEPESQSLQGAKTPDEAAPNGGQGNPAKPRLLIGFTSGVYASGARGCFGFTEEEWTKMEEDSKLHFPDRENNKKDTQ